MYTPSTIEESPDKYQKRMADIGLTNPQPQDALNEEKVRYALYTQRFYSLMDSVNCCTFVFGTTWQLYGPNQLVAMVNAVTG